LIQEQLGKVVETLDKKLGESTESLANKLNGSYGFAQTKV